MLRPVPLGAADFPVAALAAPGVLEALAAAGPFVGVAPGTGATGRTSVPVPARVFANSEGGLAEARGAAEAGRGGGTLALGFAAALATGRVPLADIDGALGAGGLPDAGFEPLAAGGVLGAGGREEAPGFGVPDALTAYAAGGGAGRLDGRDESAFAAGADGRCESPARRCADGTSDSGGGGGGDALRVESRCRMCAAGGGGRLDFARGASAAFTAAALATAASMSPTLSSCVGSTFCDFGLPATALRSLMLNS